jgi:hypothetical protein
MVVDKFYPLFVCTKGLPYEVLLIAIKSMKITRIQSDIHYISEEIAHKTSSSIDWWNLISNVSGRVSMELLGEILEEWSFIKGNIDSRKLIKTNIVISDSQD